MNELNALGKYMSNEKIIGKAMMSLLAKFEPNLCSLEAKEAIRKTLNQVKKRTFLQFIQSLQASEKRMAMREKMMSMMRKLKHTLLPSLVVTMRAKELINRHNNVL